MRLVLISIFMCANLVHAECSSESDMLNRYEAEILKAAAHGDYAQMAEPLSCLIKMQIENQGMDRLLASSYLRPFLTGESPATTVKDRRYKVVAKALEALSLHENQTVQSSFVTEFSKGDWAFYKIFCEQGNTEFCSEFLPDERAVSRQPALVAAASMLRLRQAYLVLDGTQRKLVGERIKRLYAEIPAKDRLRRKFIDQVYKDIFKISPS